MKNIRPLLLSLALLFSLAAAAGGGERRVYYLDCSYSMVTNGIWDDVCDNLKQAIRAVRDQRTEVVVVPFALDMQHHAALRAYVQPATDAGKQKLVDAIDAIEPAPHSSTYHSEPLTDFFRRRTRDGRTTYMFFMTDGQNLERPDPVPQMLATWRRRFASRHVYGFYVALCPEADNERVRDLCQAQQNHLWYVRTANININIVRLAPTAVYNARADKYFDLSLSGDVGRLRFAAAFPPDAPLRVVRTQVVGGRLRVYVAPKCPVSTLPVAAHHTLTINASGLTQYDFLVTPTADVLCTSKPERTLKITVR